MLTIASATADAEWVYELWLCTKNTSWALIERPYSCAPQTVGAVYDRPGFFVQSHELYVNTSREALIDVAIWLSLYDLVMNQIAAGKFKDPPTRRVLLSRKIDGSENTRACGRFGSALLCETP